MRHITPAICAMAIALTTSTARAHDGHGHLPEGGNSPLHYLTEPLHLLPLALFAVLAVAGLYAFNRVSQAWLQRLDWWTQSE